MKSNYKRLGDFIQEINIRNSDLKVDRLLGVSIRKVLIPSIANTIGTDMSKYKVVNRRQFAYGPVTSRNGDKISIAILDEFDNAIISQSYKVFEVIDEKELLPEYLMMWFRRPEFDRYARYMSHGSTREAFDWDELCEVELPVPSLAKQQAIVDEYNVITRRIRILEQLNTKLEETAQTIYKHWFVDFDEIALEELSNIIEFNPKYSISKGKVSPFIEMANVQEHSMNVKKIILKPYGSGPKFKFSDTILARITPCLQNGKAAFINCFSEDKIGFGSTEFIVLSTKKGVSPYYAYLLAKDEGFRSYAISSMVGSTGRERVHSDYLKEYLVSKAVILNMSKFHCQVEPFFKNVKRNSDEINYTIELRNMLLSRM